MKDVDLNKLVYSFACVSIELQKLNEDLGSAQQKDLRQFQKVRLFYRTSLPISFSSNIGITLKVLYGTC